MKLKNKKMLASILTLSLSFNPVALSMTSTKKHSKLVKSNNEIINLIKPVLGVQNCAYNSLSDIEKNLYNYIMDQAKVFFEKYESLDNTSKELYRYFTFGEFDQKTFNFMKNNSYKADDNLKHINTKKIMSAIKYDIPQFDLLFDFDFFITDDKSNKCVVTISLIYRKNLMHLPLKAINKEVKKILIPLKKRNADDDKKAEFIHDYICERCEFSHDNTVKSHTVYGCLCKNEAVCEGISRSYQLLMNKAGIDCRTVYGKAKDKYGNLDHHVWNIIKINGNWYHVDVTWDLKSSNGDKTSHDYFLKTNKEIKKDHFISESYGNSKD